MPRARKSKKPEDEQPSEGQGQPEEPEPLSLREPAVVQDDQLMKLVVVGSSAGGIQALSTLVESLPSNFSAPIVLAQHLDPQRPSNLSRILERRSKLPVVTITSGASLNVGTVYVVPANKHVVVSDGHLQLEDDHGSHPRPSVDLLLSSAAQVYGDRLTAVILTGSGVDGAAGAVEVKKANGTVIIQNPQTARFPSMPMALPPTAVDHVVDIENLAALLNDIVQEAALPREQEIGNVSGLQEILDTVTRQANVDFREYKLSTILRRINRRMAILHKTTLDEYAAYLHQHPDEIGQLVMAFLIKVTEFFRDPEAFTFLRNEIMPGLVEAGRTRGNVLRIWSAGCATGEEAYSLSLLVADVLGPELSEWSVKIFATDLDEEAINYARRGLYPESLLRNLPPDYRARFFEPVDQSFRVGKLLRQMVIFGQQDLGRGVPFPRIDIVVCRNLLIYFKPDLQQSVLDKFAYSLSTTKGYLFLGQAETVRPWQSSFDIVNKKWKIYRCTRSPRPVPIDRARANQETANSTRYVASRPPGISGKAQSGPDMNYPEPEVNLLRRYNELVLRTLPIGIALIDRSYRVVTINAAARRMLDIRELNVQDFLHATRGLPYDDVRNAIDNVFRERQAALLPEVAIKERTGAKSRHLSLNIVPVDSEVPGLELAMVSVQDVSEMVTTRLSLESVEAEQRQLLAELQITNDRLSEMNKDLQDSNEELQAANEELVLVQEELQATNEEFEATNEELQATNEELETNNEELQSTNEELETTNDELQARTNDLQDLMRSLASERLRLSEMVELAPYDIVVVRGPFMIVEAFNPGASRFFHGNEVINMPIEDVFHRPEMSQLLERMNTAFAKDTSQEVGKLAARVLTEQGDEVERTFNFRIVPTHETGGNVDGLVVYAQDVTTQIEQDTEQQLDNLKLIVEHE